MLFNILLSGTGSLAVNLIIFLLVAAALIISLSFHEFAHAYIADKLGDSTAKQMGRLTLDPRAHLDPVGTALLLLAGFGWGKPVPYNQFNLSNPKRDAALISIAGPMSNFILAAVFGLISRIIPGGGYFIILQTFIYFIVFYNLVLGFFNLIPVHPLDGFKVVNGLLPEELSIQWIQIAPYGIWILLILIVTGTTQKILDPLLSFSLSILNIGR